MNITMSPQQPMLSVTKAIPFQSGIFADVWRVTQERYYQVKKVCRSALINPALICLEQFGDTNVSSNAAVALLGTTVTSNDDTLALQSSAAGSAQNVGIQILDRTGEVLILDGATFSAKTDLIDGTNILPFQARYIALGQSVAGTANADATFKVQYL
ncbi:type 1 fimbrial protein precursor [Escherichia coli]|nr:type 1 fimbrial protein precursor [Escherichia coli]